MISAVSTMLLKGLHGATSKANYREPDIWTINTQQNTFCTSTVTLFAKFNMLCCYLLKVSLHNRSLHFKCSQKQQKHCDWNKNVPLTAVIDKTASGFKHLFWIPSVNYSRNQWATKQIPQIYRGCNCYIQLLYIYSNSYVTCNQVFLPVHNCVCVPPEFSLNEYWTEQVNTCLKVRTTQPSTSSQINTQTLTDVLTHSMYWWK